MTHRLSTVMPSPTCRTILAALPLVATRENARQLHLKPATLFSYLSHLRNCGWCERVENNPRPRQSGSGRQLGEYRITTTGTAVLAVPYVLHRPQRPRIKTANRPEYHRRYGQEYRAKRKAAGLCVNCGTAKEPGREHRSWCLDCTQVYSIKRHA